MDNCKTEKAIPFSYCLGFSTFSVPLHVLKIIQKQCLRSTAGDCGVRVAGLLFGKKQETNIHVTQFLKMNGNKKKKKSMSIKDFCQKTKTEFLGFYSNGQIPDEKDVHNLQGVIKTVKSSLFLLKSNQSDQDDLSTVFECVFDSIVKDVESIYVVQAHSTPECGNHLIKEPEPSDEKITAKSKIFYIGFQFTIYDQLTRLEKLELPEVQKSKMWDNRINMHPNCKEYWMTLCKIAEAEGLLSLMQSFNDYINKKELDFDCVKVLKNLCKKGRIDVTYNFEIRLKSPVGKSVSCAIKILDDYFSCASEVKIEESCLKSTCSFLELLCIDAMNGFPWFTHEAK